MSLESMVGVEYGWLVGVCRCSGWGLDYVTVSVFGWCVSFLTSVEKYVDFIKVLICSHLVFLLFIVIPSYIFRQISVQCGQLGSYPSQLRFRCTLCIRVQESSHHESWTA